MSDLYERSREELEQLVRDYPGVTNLNEATTRLRLIDHLFFRCLGWSEHDVLLEESFDSEYADYEFYAPRRSLIVEAKKEGNTFELPIGDHRIEQSLRSLSRDHPNLANAIRQVAQYCHSRGTPFAVVSNGHQLVAFLAIRNDGTPPFEGKAIVFASLDQMLANFHDLWQVLSKPAVEAKHLHYRLLGEVRPEPSPKLSSKIVNYPRVKARNNFQRDLQIITELVLEDITAYRELEETFLRECYSASGALSQYSLTSKAILESRYAALFDQVEDSPTLVPAITKHGISQEMLAESFSRRPLLLIGDVGAGKTSFLRNLMKVEAPHVFQRALAFYVDLGSQGTLTSDLREFVVTEMERQLYENYGLDLRNRNFVRGVYHGEILRFSQGIYSDLRETNADLYAQKEIEFLAEKLEDRSGHMRASLEHLSKGQQKQVILFIDNADQRHYEIQQEAFLISQEIAQHWPTTVFVALRPETFHRSRVEGALSGYHPKAFTISPPRIDTVLEKRLSFALKITSGDTPLQSLDDAIGMRVTTLDAIIKMFLTSMRENRALIECIDNIAAGNVRIALDLVKSFFSSGHVDMNKILRIYEESGSYTVPLHEFMRAIQHGDHEDYDPERSPIANIFDISTRDPREHFLVPTLISLLNSSVASESPEGFVELEHVYDHLQALGFTDYQVDMAIARAHKKQLLETAGRKKVEAGSTPPSAVRVTSVGSYHVARICRMFAYIDAIIVDTPILDDTYRDQISDAQDIAERLTRTSAFIKYLDEQWDLGGYDVALFDWTPHSRAVRNEIKDIQERLDRRRRSSVRNVP